MTADREPGAISRRAMLGRMALLAAGAPMLGAALAACVADEPSYPHAADLRFPRPDAPVRWTVYPENPPIEPGRPVESDGVLRVFNWDSYVAPQVLRDFERDLGVHVEVSTYYDMTQAVSKLRAGAVRPDVFFPTVDTLGRLIVSELIQPIQPAYLPHRSNIWPELQEPFYDLGADYTVPYAVYTTGLGWRRDLTGLSDLTTLPNPWEALWNPAFTDHAFVLDDYREGIAMMLLREGATDINAEDATVIQRAATQLVDLARAVNLKWSIDDYTYLPEGRAWIHQAWSGDMVTAPYYGQGTPDEVAPTLGYWTPTDGRGEVNNDLVVIPRNAEHPVLAHRFIDYLLTDEHALDNYAWLGYQQPLRSLTLDTATKAYPWLVEPNLERTFATPEQLATGLRQLELDPTADAAWQQAWIQFKSGG